MVRDFGERLAVFWLLGTSLAVSSRAQLGASQAFPAATSFQHRRGLVALNPQTFPVASLETLASTSDASTMRNLRDLETSTGANGNGNQISKKCRWLVIVLLTATIVMAAIAIAVAIAIIFLLRQWHRNNKCGNMRVWTNQLSSLQHSDYSRSEDNSCRASARMESAAKLAHWESDMHDDVKSSAVKRESAADVPCSVPYALLQAATQNFSSCNLLGQGSFGLVYKATLDDDVIVAVKRLNGAGSKRSQEEFKGEVALMSKIEHPNLVALLGFSQDGPEPMVVYELMQCGSLHDHIHGPSHGAALTWRLRLKIALEAARGLEHLHENCKPAIIHRDFKASNILLDAGFNAKVSDFGLAVALEEGGLLKDDVQVQGTFGYIAPEYLMDGALTEKSDVYGFGVVLLELLTGRLPIDTSLPLGSQSLVTWVMPLLANRAQLMEILDPNLQDSVSEKQFHQVAAVAILCVQAEPSYRPRMADVVQSLRPLVPQELGGALPECCSQTSPTDSSSTSKSLDSEDLETERQSGLSHTTTSDGRGASFSVHERIPKSSIITTTTSTTSTRSLARSRSWEDAAGVRSEQHSEGPE